MSCLNFERKNGSKAKLPFLMDECGSYSMHIVLTVLGFAGYFGIAVVCIPLWAQIVVTVLFIYCFIQYVTSLATTQNVDPGYVPLQTKPSMKIQQAEKESPLNNVEEIMKVQEQPLVTKETELTIQTFYTPQIQELQENQENKQKKPKSTADKFKECLGEPMDFGAGQNPYMHQKKQEDSKFCEYCQQEKPERAHHCKRCQRCIYQYDHHCPFVCNCVGQNNYPYFFKFCFYATLTALISLSAQIYAIASLKVVKFYFPEQNSLLALVFIPAPFAALFGCILPCSILLGNCFRLCTGDTLIERKKKGKGTGECKKNWQNRLGEHWLLWMLKISKK